MKKIIAFLLVLCLISLAGCSKILTDNMSSSSYLESVDSVIESNTNTPTETSSVSSESSVPDNTTTESKTETPSQFVTSSETSSAQETPTAPVKPRPEKVTKIYEFNINTTVSEPIKKIFNDSQNGNTLPYCLYLPDSYTPSKKYPVILFLHGAGEIGSDNTLQLNNIKNMFVYNADYIAQSILICPQTPEWWSLDRAYGDGQGTLSSAMHLLEEVQNKYSCDKNRIYLTGLSMGSFATWDLLEHYGNVFAAAVPVCGGGNEMNAAAYVDIPIVMYHGTADPTVSFQSSQRTYDAIVAAGGTKALLISLEGVGHDAWKQAYADRNMFAWLFSQDKSKDTFVKYQVTPSFKIVDTNGNNVIAAEDLLVVEYEEKGNAVDIKIQISPAGKSKLEKAYTASGGKEFTVYCLSQKIYSFTATTPPIDNILLITGVFNTSNYLEFYRTVQTACFENEFRIN